MNAYTLAKKAGNNIAALKFYHILRTFSKGLYIIRRLWRNLKIEVSIMVYYGCFHCHLLYGNTAWGNASMAEK